VFSLSGGMSLTGKQAGMGVLCEVVLVTVSLGGEKWKILNVKGFFILGLILNNVK
jgi:hypothetical protein